MKKATLLIVMISTVFLFTACAKGKTTGNNETPKVVEKTAIPEPPAKTVEELKFEEVYASMTDRFKGEVKITDVNQFISDLTVVLETRENFNADDLDPFYLIDKTHKVSKDYVPADLVHLTNCEYYKVNKNNLSLRPEATQALKELGAAAKADGVTLTVSSTYRSYEYQDNLFNYWVSVDGLEEAERESARPGTSQHQLGMAMDFAPVDDAFAETEAGKWVYKNAAKFGWSLSFPQDHEDVTGYRWESWHFRYVGIPAVNLQKKYFADVQQYMIEFIDAWCKAWEQQ
ncbi:MAG: M15 family metallopeptidase [Treponema sp.]|nr:M15 family metallopeptidase [Treponema sp.]